MQLKSIFAALVFSSSLGASAQVAPAAYVAGRPIGIGVGLSSYSLDYGPGRRMEGPVIRGSVGVWRGFGVDVSARSLFMFTPAALTRMQQSTFLAGAYYEGPERFHVRPFARVAGGVGVIEFPSRNPAYTRDSYTVYAPSGGVEVPVGQGLFVRGEYEYQFWKQYQGPRYLNPEGFTIGVTYYLRGMRGRSR
jgi:hypothetical protein